jgi:hypothetical protein
MEEFYLRHSKSLAPYSFGIAFSPTTTGPTAQSLMRSSASVPRPRNPSAGSRIFSPPKTCGARLTNADRKVEVWPDLTVDQCDSYLGEQIAAWDAYLAKLTPDILTSTITYRNTKGDLWTNTVADILIHVPMHSAHHRGQIIADLRMHGYEPPYIDFIEAVRRGHLA